MRLLGKAENRGRFMSRKKRLLAGIFLLIFSVCVGRISWKALDHSRGAADYVEASALAGLGADADTLPETDEYAAVLAETDLSALREVNGEVAGWIAIPDTEVFYPVMQAADNSYYLDHTWNREKSSVGAIFIDCEGNPDFSDFQTLIYGHQMQNGSMFGGLHRYKDDAYLREHPAIYLATDEGVQRYDIFAAFEAGVKDVIYRLDIEQEGIQQELIDYCLSRSVVDTGIVPKADDHIITLSTCTGRGYATRWVVQGVRR